MRALWLVENYVISRYNYLAWGDYNTEALIFKIAAARFLDVFKERTSKRTRNCSYSDNHLLSDYTKTIILLRLSEYCRIIPSTSSRRFIRKYSLRLRRIIVNYNIPDLIDGWQLKSPFLMVDSYPFVHLTVIPWDPLVGYYLRENSKPSKKPWHSNECFVLDDPQLYVCAGSWADYNSFTWYTPLLSANELLLALMKEKYEK